MNRRAHDLIAQDAMRLLSNARNMVEHLETHGEGISPACRDIGELMLQDAVVYLAWGDTNNAKACIEDYERWLETGEAGWPFFGITGP